MRHSISQILILGALMENLRHRIVQRASSPEARLDCEIKCLVETLLAWKKRTDLGLGVLYNPSLGSVLIRAIPRARD